jgi:hypothetical protein
MARSALTLALFLSGLFGTAPLSAASFSLTPRETQEAIQFGQKSVVSEEFGREWRSANAAGESLTVVTPFFRLAQAARNAAFRSQTLKPRDIDALLKEHQGRLQLWAFLRGSREDFARWYRPVLMLPGKGELQPTFVQNERTALRQEDGRFLARSVYAFPTDGLDPRGRVTLVVRDKDEREVAKFVVDLSTIR